MIQIPKSEILAEVRKTTQYIGAKTHMYKPDEKASGTLAADGTAFESVGAIEENEEILWRFVCESVSEIRRKGVEVKTKEAVEGAASAEADVYVEAPDIDGLEEHLRPYLIYITTYKWLMLGNVVNDRMPLWKENAMLHLSIVRQKLGGYANGGGSEADAPSVAGTGDVPVMDEEAYALDEAEACSNIGREVPQWFEKEKTITYKREQI